MLRFAIALTLIGTAAVAGPADAPGRDEIRLAKRLDGLVAGAPKTCISPSPSGTSSHAGNLVLTEDRSGILYASHFRGGCTARESDALISFRTTSQLCSGDIVQVQDTTSGITSGNCSYSDFTPYRRAR